MARALTALSIGPLLPDGRDGLLADLKTYSALGLHGAAVATQVAGAGVGAEAAVAQLEAVLATVRVDAVKLATPADADLLAALAESLVARRPERFVLDPGAAVFDDESLRVLRARLLPLAAIAIMGQAEAQALTGLRVESWEDMREAARAVADLGAANVVVKGANQQEEGRMTDLLFDGSDYRDFTAERVDLVDVAGAGTTFAAAIAATLAKGETVAHSVASGKAYVTKALQSTYDLGGAASLHHFYRYWRPGVS
jgi:hydroxymethylpyrimidine/phosphomethylpyrimidine kinase